ncbi:radial spoke head 1 homolog [Ctenocephalides felis]|uniref:radial spoke head 1 homolog n=1 Tax=Ctenocephalides felis TaxID=7515 RepID=UPI000E6E1849|nr:radial spoke head 1 homolog [Ctenocephalides felis]XP_026482756.1 radial spoke head 1 homolog [Ctenocephalides felis]
MSDEEEGESPRKNEGEDADKYPYGDYDGERNVLGDRHGFGWALLPNGDQYEGQYRKGLRHGEGQYVFKNGARYSGEWRKGLKHGIGKFLYTDGSRYEGDFKKDLRHGFGVYYYPNGDNYEGSWRRNKRHGLGTYIYALTQTKFMGTWQFGVMEGPGQLVHPRHRYYGSWSRNLPRGNGCFTFELNCMQHGYYTWIRDPQFDAAIYEQLKQEEQQPPQQSNDAEEDPTPTQPKGVVPLWRARAITKYSPDLLPPQAVPLPLEVESLDSPLSEPYLSQIELLHFEPESPCASSGENERFGEDGNYLNKSE